jgi:hypothetical protein
LKQNTSISGSNKSSTIKDEANESSQNQLAEALKFLDTRIAEKEAKERAIELEEDRVEAEAEKARVDHLAEGADEKEILGAQILKKIKRLKQDKLIKKARAQIEGHVILHERPITNAAELMPSIPRDRSVRELFQIDGRGILTYNQVYNPEHFAEGYMHHYMLNDPLHFGYKLSCPADFQKLSIHSIRGFHESLEKGEHLKILAKDIKQITKDIEEDPGDEAK